MKWTASVLVALRCFCEALPATESQLPVGSSFGVPGTNATFDYVVVGGGTAGLTVATRLAQDGRYSVAVVEAGGFYEQDNGNHSVIPGYSLYPGPSVDWNFVTTPQEGELARSVQYTRGKCLGGSSGRNIMVYQRPTVETMQKWADEVQDASWTWPNVLRYFERSATLTPPPTSRPTNATPGYDLNVFDDGPLQVTYPPWVGPFALWLLRAASQLGLPVKTDGFQSGSLIGHTYVATSIDPVRRERSSSETSYLPLGIETQQLTVYIRSLVKKLVFNGTVAAGINVETNGIPFTVSARREVIVSAGTFQSPQLLMVSGIGPESTLENLGIDVVANRPGVGQNLWDTPLICPTYAVNVETQSVYTNHPDRLAEAAIEYNENRTGYLTSSAEAFSFEKISNISSLNFSDSARRSFEDEFPSDWPEVEFGSFTQWFGPYLGSTPPNNVQNFAGMAIGLIATLSRGYVTINSSDMANPPIINPMWLSDPADQELAVAAIRRSRQYFATPALRSITIGEEIFPGANVTSYDDLLAALRAQVSTYYHASSTCKMGSENDTMAVVDSKARVIGVENLRVVDASAFPFLPPGQPQATVYMLAEKIADEILAGN